MRVLYDEETALSHRPTPWLKGWPTQFALLLTVFIGIVPLDFSIPDSDTALARPSNRVPVACLLGHAVDRSRPSVESV